MKPAAPCEASRRSGSGVVPEVTVRITDREGLRRGRVHPLQVLAARYLARQWEEGHVLDPVARFHLGNGARLERINWLADTSPRGLRQSLGMMVNYVYALEDVERNHESYVNRRVAACSASVERLARLADGEDRGLVGTGGADRR